MAEAAVRIIENVREGVSPTYAATRSRLRSDVEAEQKRQHRELMKANQRKTDLRNLMDTEWGRRIVWDLLGKCSYQGSEWHENPRVSERIGGQRTIAIRLADELVEVSCELWLEMQREAHADASRD